VRPLPVASGCFNGREPPLPTLSNRALDPSVDSAGPAIRLESIGKCYRIYKNPQDRFKQALLDRLGHWGHRQNGPLYREHWALRDISCELPRGEALGIVGRNGAGKSTLLQIVAGTLDASQGRVETSGRITALLELGSGFNFEFTGRENVFLNAQILGLSRDQAMKRFDEIEQFADIGDFIDQPVKIYSSGMVMRLAFAVQTVLEPDILIVDEALGVGDAKFQSKCFRRIRQMRDDGVAILLVSHDINAIISFCDRAILLDEGRLVETGRPQYVAKKYIERLYGEPHDSTSDDADGAAEVRAPQVVAAGDVAAPAAGVLDGGPQPAPFVFGSKVVEILRVVLTDDQGRETAMLRSGQWYRLTQRVIAHADIADLASGFIIRNRHGIELFGITNKTTGVAIGGIKAGQVFDVSVSIQMWLAAGDYFVQAANAAPEGDQYDCRIDALHFTVIGTPELFTTSLVNLNSHLSFALVGSNAMA
jgi:lipopolysaccharide transport system ATP-binding protein